MTAFTSIDRRTRPALPLPLVTALSAAAFIALWALAARAVSSPLILPGPADAARYLARNRANPALWRHLGASCCRALTAWALASAAGCALGAASAFAPRFSACIAFPLTVIRAAPVVSVALVLVFVLGTEALPAAVAALMALPVMTDAARGAVEKTPRDLAEAMRAYGFSRRRLVLRVYVPAGLPALLAGARSAFGLCWKAAAAGEVLALPRWGAGTLLYQAKVHLETEEVFAVTALLALLCFAFERLFALALTAGRPRRAAASPRHINREPHRPHEQAERDFTHATASGEKGLGALAGEGLALRGLRVRRGALPVYDGFTAVFPPGSVTALLGKSGAGKTTLLHCAAGLLAPEAGSVTFNGARLARVSYLFQDARLLPWLTAGENAALPLSGTGARERSARFLERAGLGGRFGALPGELSGGEAQRAALARAFAYPAPVLLMDEAFRSQDIAQKLRLMRLTLALIAEQGRTALMVTHDAREAVCMADRALVLAGCPARAVLDIALPPRAGEDPGALYTRLTPARAEAEAAILSALGAPG